VTEAFSFDEGGDAAKPVIFSVVRGGHFEYLPPSPTGAGARAGLRP